MAAFGFTHLSQVPVRREPSESSEMVNQLLFGDWVRVLEQKGNWADIEMIEDGYRGWVDARMFLSWDKNELPSNERLFVNDTFLPTRIRFANGKVWTNRISMGATFPRDWLNGKTSGLAEIEIGQVSISVPIQGLREAIPASGKELGEVGRLFLGAPYLWGGRSIWGMDCSGFTQMVFRLCGKFLPRDSSQQIKSGEKIAFEERQPGDLAFFGDRQNGKVKHVGLLIPGNGILHASGRVREDRLSEEGIINTENETLTHELLGINRYI